MTTPLFLLRCVQMGLSMADLELLSIGVINDMFIESRNDSSAEEYCIRADQKLMDEF